VIRLDLLTRDERGASVMEFGLLVVPLCLVLLGMLDMGYQMYLRSSLQGALNDVARAAVVQNPNLGSAGTVQDRVEQGLASRMAGLGNVAPDVRMGSFESYTQVNVPEKLLNDANSNGEVDPGDCWLDVQENGTHDINPEQGDLGGSDDVVVFRASMTVPRIVPLVGLAGLPEDYDINVEAAVRRQPFASQDTPPTACEPNP
jgi:Flp pilus assembly pilin Flp